MNKEEKEFLFNIITLLLASLLGIGGAFVFYFHNISNKDYSIWCPLVFIILIEWLNYRLWIGKKFIEIEVPKKKQSRMHSYWYNAIYSIRNYNLFYSQ